MSAPFVYSVGTLAGGVSATFIWPTHGIDDIGLIVAESGPGGINGADIPSGWAHVPNSPQYDSTNNTALNILWKRATSAAEADAVTGSLGNHVSGRIIVVRGCYVTGNPWDVGAGGIQTTPSTSVSIPGTTTTGPDRLVILAVSWGTDTSAAQASGWTNSNLTSITEHADGGDVTGHGGGSAVASGIMASAGNYGATSATLATSSGQGIISLALRPSLIQYVGGTTDSHTGSASYTVSLTGLTGGLASAPAEGDIVIVAAGQTGKGNVAVDVNSSNWNKITELFSNDTRDTNFSVFYKVMGATPDTSIDFAVTQYPHTCAIHVWRGVDTTTPLDVTSTTATGINGSRADGPSITPTTAGAVIITCGHGTEQTGAFTGPSGMSNFLQSQLGVVYEGTTGIASYSGWTSGAYDPAAWTGGTSGTSDSWAAVTLALRPATGVSVGLTGTSSTISIGNLGVTESDNVALSGGSSTTSSGSLGNNLDISLVGDQSTSTNGQLVTSNELNLSGFQITSFSGTLEPHTDSNLQLSGLQVLSAIGNVSYSDQDNVNLAGISSASQSGTIQSTDRTLTISGIGSAFQAGSILATNSKSVSGSQLTTGTGLVSPHTDSNISLSGNQIQTSSGNLGVTESDNVALSGSASSIYQGAITTSKTLSLSGEQSQASVGTVSTSKTLSLTGIQSTSAAGSLQVSMDSTVAIYGTQIPTAVGNTAYTEEEIAQLLGISSVSYSGAVIKSLTISLSGVQSSAQIGDVATYTSRGISGFESTSTVGDISVSTDSTLDLSGNSLAQSIVNVGYSEADNVLISGIASSSNLGSLSNVVTIELSGAQASATTGNIVVDNTIQQVGYEITTYTGSVVPTTGIVVGLIGSTSSTSSGDFGVTESDNPSLTGSTASVITGSISSADVEVAIYGVSNQSAIGSINVDKGFDLSGFEITTTTGNIDTFVSPDIILTGSSATSSAGNVGSTADLNNVSGVSSTIGLGSTSTNIELAISGISADSSTGVIHPDKSFGITGFEITSSTGLVEDSSESYLPISGISTSTGEGSIGAYTESSININGQRLVTSTGEVTNVKYISLLGSQSTTELGVTKSTPMIGMGGNLAEITIGDTQAHTDSNITLTGLERISSSGSIGAFSHSYLQLNGQTASTLTSDLSSVERYITLAGQNSESVVGYINPNIGVSLSGYEVYGYTSTNIIIENEVYVFLTPTPSISSVLLTIAAIRGLDLTNTVKVSEAKRNWSVVSEERNWVVKGFRRDWRVFSEIRNWKIKSDWIK